MKNLADVINQIEHEVVELQRLNKERQQEARDHLSSVLCEGKRLSRVRASLNEARLTLEEGNHVVKKEKET